MLGLPAALLSGCDNLPIVGRVYKAFDFAMFGQPDVPLTRSDVDNLPYASIRAKMGRSGKVFMILGRYDGNDLHWISADSAVIATRQGRIVKTVGLTHDIMETRFPEADPIADSAQHLHGAVQVTRLVDFAAESRFGVQVTSTFTRVGRERVEILEKIYDTLLIQESARVEQIGWSYENQFWVDRQSGFVWKSVQHISPELPPIELEILKPAT